VGLFFAARGCDVVLTDLEELVPHLELNARSNLETIHQSGGSVCVRKLDWDVATEADIHALKGNKGNEGTDEGGFGLVLGSELLYVGTLDEGFKPLIRVLKTVLTTAATTTTTKKNDTNDINGGGDARPVAFFADEWDYGMRDTFFEDLRHDGFRVDVKVKNNCFHIYSISLP